MKLNDAQERAASHQTGPLLILAGAGAGKTRVIVERIARLIHAGTAPEKILAVTFTNKAAREMKDRIQNTLRSSRSLQTINYELGTPFVGTFHGLCLHILKTFHTAAGLPKRFTIYDRADSLRAARDAIKAAGFDPKQLEPRRVLSIMSRQKGDDVSRVFFLDSKAASYIDEAVAEVWERYDAILKKEKALDFDDILCVALKLLREHSHIRDHFQKAWSHVHVDEYQDTNRVQYELVRLLVAEHRNIAVVGDIDQNIYSWRGASITHIMRFEEDYPEADVVVLTENYRSTKTILAAANQAIEKNIQRREKVLVTQNPDGEKIKLGGFLSEAEEAAFIAEEAARRIRRGEEPNEIAVLYRANFQSRVLEEAFLTRDVPYQVLGTRFFERKEVKDALSYLRAALNPDSVSDITRSIQTPSRGIGKVTLAKLVAQGRTALSGAQREKVENFYRLLARIRERTETERPSVVMKYVIEESGLSGMLREGDYEDEERLENLRELVSVASKYDAFPPGEGIDALIEEAALQSDQDELSIREQRNKYGVKLMTVHAAKGLEFNTVCIAGLEDGLFPHERDGDESVDAEEERRLFYVALTRAKKVAYLTYALSRRIFGSVSTSMPSEFITELDPALTEVVSSSSFIVDRGDELDVIRV